MENLSKEIKHLGRGGSINHKTPLSASFQFDFKTLIFISPAPPAAGILKDEGLPELPLSIMFSTASLVNSNSLKCFNDFLRYPQTLSLKCGQKVAGAELWPD